VKEELIKVVIDGIETSVRPRQTILEVARSMGIRIPTLCHDERLEPYGGCRLCIVKVKNTGRLLTACTTPVSKGMEIITRDEEIERIRKTLVSLILSNHPNDCMRCEKTGECTLQDLAYEYGVDGAEYAGERWDMSLKEDNPFITYEPNKCILCSRCTRICNEVVMAGTIELTGRGFNVMPDTAFRRPRSLENCEFCGQCVSTCPVGALTDRKARGKGRAYEMKRVRTVCPYCGTGCQLMLNVKDGRVAYVTSAYDDPVTKGNLCIKGRYGYEFIHHPDRIRRPLIREGDGYREATWDEALNLVARRFRELMDKYGAKAVGAFSSARCTNEENFLLSKFTRVVFGTNNVDNCARV